MKPHRRQRLAIILFIATGLSVAVGLTLYALSQNIDLFYTPTQVAAGEVAVGQKVRIGGMVREGSYVAAQDSLRGQFDVTDYANSVSIHYEEILPDLFREGQGIVVEGSLDSSGQFQASRVLAKHDENYMSQEVKAALEASGATPGNHAGMTER